jgi:hypothetical protein
LSVVNVSVFVPPRYILNTPVVISLISCVWSSYYTSEISKLIVLDKSSNVSNNLSLELVKLRFVSGSHKIAVEEPSPIFNVYEGIIPGSIIPYSNKLSTTYWTVSIPRGISWTLSISVFG